MKHKNAAMQHKQFAFKADSVADDGTFKGYGSVFGNVDMCGPKEDDDIAIYIGAAELAAQEFMNRRVYADQDALDTVQLTVTDSGGQGKSLGRFTGNQSFSPFFTQAV